MSEAFYKWVFFYICLGELYNVGGDEDYGGGKNYTGLVYNKRDFNLVGQGGDNFSLD